MSRTLPEAALHYAARGWALFPCHEPGDGGCSCRRPDCASPTKHPRTPRGLHDATTDPATIDRRWRRWPTANIAGTGSGAGNGGPGSAGASSERSCRWTIWWAGSSATSKRSGRRRRWPSSPQTTASCGASTACGARACPTPKRSRSRPPALAGPWPPVGPIRGWRPGSTSPPPSSAPRASLPPRVSDGRPVAALRGAAPGGPDRVLPRSRLPLSDLGLPAGSQVPVRRVLRRRRHRWSSESITTSSPTPGSSTTCWATGIPPTTPLRPSCPPSWLITGGAPAAAGRVPVPDLLAASRPPLIPWPPRAARRPGASGCSRSGACGRVLRGDRPHDQPTTWPCRPWRTSPGGPILEGRREASQAARETPQLEDRVPARSGRLVSARRRGPARRRSVPGQGRPRTRARQAVRSSGLAIRWPALHWYSRRSVSSSLPC